MAVPAASAPEGSWAAAGRVLLLPGPLTEEDDRSQLLLAELKDAGHQAQLCRSLRNPAALNSLHCPAANLSVRRLVELDNELDDRCDGLYRVTQRGRIVCGCAGIRVLPTLRSWSRGKGRPLQLPRRAVGQPRSILTMRQRAVQEIGSSALNARQYLGKEGPAHAQLSCGLLCFQLFQPTIQLE